MPRKPRPLNRDSGTLRDASLVVIASEDTHAVDQYFARFRTQRVQFLVLPTTDGNSSPAAVMQRLDEFKSEHATEENDQFWVCIDLDHWAQSNHIKNLTQVLQHCRQKGYSVAVSNPCFELWLLLHFEDTPLASCQSCDDVSKRLTEILGGYNKAKCCGSLPFTKTNVTNAVERASKIDDGTDVPESPLTRMYKIMNVLLERDSIEFADS